MKYYSGIGSRQTPMSVCREMTLLARELEEMGYWLRSGGAEGADFAFQKGVIKNAIIWLPKPDFNQEFQDQFPQHTYRHDLTNHPEAWESVEKFHPAPDRLSEFGRNCMARNYLQIFDEGKLSEFVVCWTKGGGLQGGTSQALKIGAYYNIPIFNFYSMTREEILKQVHFMDLVK